MCKQVAAGILNPREREIISKLQIRFIDLEDASKKIVNSFARGLLHANFSSSSKWLEYRILLIVRSR